MVIRLRTLGITLLAAVTLFVAGTILFVYFGVYNIAALKQHTKPVYNLLEYAMQKSVAVRAGVNVKCCV